LLLLLVVTINFFKNLLNFPFFFTHKKVYFWKTWLSLAIYTISIELKRDLEFIFKINHY
jgi:hypothetical protein